MASGTLHCGAVAFSDGVAQNHASKVVQVKHFADNTKTYLSDSGYYWGGNDSTDGLAFTMKSTSNKIYISAALAYGQHNVNGGTKLLVNGNTGYWSTQTTTAYSGGSSSYTGGFNTAEDGHGTDQQYSIGVNHLSLISSTTMPSTFYLGFYWHEGTSGSFYFNRQKNDNGGSAISGMMVMELEDVS
jgi:hypothetical protein